MRIVLLGPPGAGKGTQAYRMADRFCLAHLASGDILRSQRESGTELGRRVAAIMDAGKLVPDDVIIEVMMGRITKPDTIMRFLLDGFPRTLPQAQALDEALKKVKAPLWAAVLVDVGDEVLVERLSGRRLCPVCQRSYHVVYSAPAKPGVCDDDGSALLQRDDDKPEVIKKRLRVYHENTEPLLDYYDGKKLLERVDGSRTIDEVTNGLGMVLESLCPQA